MRVWQGDKEELQNGAHIRETTIASQKAFTFNTKQGQIKAAIAAKR